MNRLRKFRQSLRVVRNALEIQLVAAAAGIVTPDELRQALTARSARSITAPRPEWNRLRPAVLVLSRTLAKDPAARSKTDRFAARIRDTFDAQGCTIADEETLYVSLVTCAFLVEAAASGAERGAVTPKGLQDLAAIAQTFTAAVIDYLPAEARP